MALYKASDAYKKLADEVDSMAGTVNSALADLESRGLESRAFHTWQNSYGGRTYGSSGASYNDLQSQYWQLQKLMNDESLTTKGYRQELIGELNAVGIDMKTLKKSSTQRLHNYASKMYEARRKYEEYEKTASGIASRTSSQRLVNIVEDYIKSLRSPMSAFRSVNKAVEEIARRAGSLDYVTNAEEGLSTSPITDGMSTVIDRVKK